MHSSNPLLSASSPWILKADLSGNAQAAVRESGQVGLVVEVDCTGAATLGDFFSLLSTELEFPEYFGGNWAALKDCLTDLDWLPAASYVLIFRNSCQLLIDDTSERRAFLKTMQLAAEEWASPVELGEWWDRSAKPFHVLLDLGVSEWAPELLSSIGDLAV